MNRRIGAFVAEACLIMASCCFASDALFCKASRNYDEAGNLGKIYRRELETRMFTTHTWRQRLYYSSYEPDVNETFEIYSKPDGSRWLIHRTARPALSRIIGRRIWLGHEFDLTKELDAVKITGREVLLPPEVAKEIELLWGSMLPGREEATTPRTLHVHAPLFIAFAREKGSVQTGKICSGRYDSPIYRAFVDVIKDLRDVCDRGGNSRDPVFRRLPTKIQRLRSQL